MIDLISDHIERQLRHGPVALHPVRNDSTFRAGPLSPAKGLIGSGSALIALNIAEEIAGSYGTEVSLAPDLSTLKDDRVRNIFMIDDFIGSGRSVVECLKTWRSHPTIRSWTSYHLIDFHLLAYSFATRGLKRVEESRLISMANVRTHAAADDFSNARWTSEEEEEVRRICFQYANNWRNALGVGGVAALVVFDHTVPNNLPRILLQDRDKAGGDWVPFFAPGDRRMEPAQAAELAGYRPLGSRSSRSVETPGLVASEQTLLDADMLAVLRSIEQGLTLTRQIQQNTLLTDFQIRTLINRATDLGLVGTQGALTEAGLDWMIDRRHDPEAVFEDAPTHYYPTQLRGVDEV